MLFPALRTGPAWDRHNINQGAVMNRVLVESSVLASVLYLHKPRLLEIEFHSGLLYQYFDVPQRSYMELLAAESKGAYFNANIRNRFSCKQIDSTSRTDYARD
jgi:hypothetical protein